MATIGENTTFTTTNTSEKLVSPKRDVKNKENIKPCKRKERDESHDEYQYLDLINQIIKTGNIKGDRTGVTIILFVK